MSTQNKEINHDFKIGDIVYILKDYSIRKGIISAMEYSICTNKETSDTSKLLYKDTKCYTVCLITERDNKFSITSGTHYRDSYSYDKVYANVDDLLSDLRIKLLYLQSMTNEELVNNIVCKNCRVPINSTRPCDVFNKEYCFIYSSALRIANEKDKQYKE